MPMPLPLITSIFLGIVVATHGAPYFSYGRCSYAGDPHLTPFPSVWNQTMHMYSCQKAGWDTLLQNKWIQVLVKVGSNPNVILDYVVTFYNDRQQISCVLIGSSGSSTCASSSSIVSVTNTGGSSWNHWYQTAQYLSVQISSFSWGTGKRYDVNIRQTMELIKQSTGACVKWECPVERMVSTAAPVVVKICDIYFTAARQRVLGRVDDGAIRYMIMACQNDLTLTLNVKLAQSLVGQVIHHSLDQTDGESYQSTVIKIEENVRLALLEANRLASKIVGNGDTCWQQKRCLDNSTD